MIAAIQFTLTECILLGLAIWLCGVVGAAFVFLLAAALRDRRRNEWKERCERETWSETREAQPSQLSTLKTIN